MSQQELVKILETPNVASLLDDQELNAIAIRSMEEFQIDCASRVEWEERSREGLKIAQQVWENKTTPWEGAANIKFPLIAGAAIQFASRAYPQIIGNEIVRTQVIGRDADGIKRARAQRIQRHLNYQLFEEMEEWEEETDKLLHGLPVLGTMFKKTYFSPSLGRNVSELCLPQDVVVNHGRKNLDQARRVSHVFDLWLNDVVERQRGGLWLEKNLNLIKSGLDPQGPFRVIEQHRWLDLDHDDYEEPYVVTLISHEAPDSLDSDKTQLFTGQLVRMIPRFDVKSISSNEVGKIALIRPHQYFTKYTFLPDFSGKFYDTGFGQLLQPLNEAINVLINELLDAGKLANMQSGFMSKQLRMRGGEVRLAPGEWKFVNAGVDLRAGLFTLNYKEPSSVLFQLLGLMIDAGKQLSSVAEVLSGQQSGVNVPATTTLALIEQGLKVFSAINKRIYRSLKQEFLKLFELNARFLEDVEYFRVLDEENVIARQDYQTGDCDVRPVADPNQSTDIQRTLQAEALMKTIGLPGSAEPHKIMHRYYEALRVESLDEFHPSQAPPPGPPPPEVQDIQAKIQERQAKLPEQIKLIKSEALLNLARAEAAEIGPQIEELKIKLDTLLEIRNKSIESGQANADVNRPGSFGMETVPPDGIGVPTNLPEAIELASPLGGGIDSRIEPQPSPLP